MSPGPATKRRSDPARAVLSALVSVGLLGWLWSRVDASAALALLREASVGPLLLAAALGPVQVTLMAERWRRATKQLGLELDRREAVLEYALSVLLNQVLPGGVAGDVVRVWRQRAPERPVGPVLRAAVAERVLGLGVHVVVTLAGLAAWGWVHPDVPRPAGAVGVAVALGVVLASSLASRDVRVASFARGVIGGQLGISALLTASFLGGFALCGHALGQPLGWAVLTVVPVVLLAMIVPFSVGGWGLREAVAMAVLPALGWSPEAALAVSTAYGLTALAGALPGALVPLVR